ncbi:TetR/AcrR family transcriptional regulator [Nocardia arthritidis]|uniref:TetR/AcrR family transcriptional regulator n=1 Tax=Nocardia arthritidis TaxID=228602 RepID=UPI00142DB517|nr:helix-turn-helix domain-containing protein [Nocardia arthritidis]
MPKADSGPAQPSDEPTRPRRRYAKRLQPADRREQLLDAALRIITTGGFAEVTIAAVAERGGVTRPVVYDSFGNRDELLRELIDRETARLRDAVVHALDDESTEPGADPHEAIAIALARFLTAVRGMPDTWRLVYFPIDGVPPPLRERIRKARDELRIPLRRLVGEWLADRPAGEGAEEVDLDVLVEVVQAGVHTVTRLALDRPEQFGVPRLLTVLDLLLHEAQ